MIIYLYKRNKMVNYGKSMIYKLCCKDPNITDIYIGSTTNFSRRKAEHKKSCNNENDKRYNQNVYQFIRSNGGFNNFDMILVENVNVDNKRDLEKIERDHIDKLQPSLNSRKSYRSDDEKQELKKQYYEENKEWLIEKNKEHYENNKEYYTQYKKKYYEKNKELLNQKTKKYYEENKEHLKEKNKEYREKNKEEIKKQRKEYDKKYREDNKEKIKKKVECEFCNCSISKNNIKQHQQTLKCKKFQFIEDSLSVWELRRLVL